MEFVCGHNGFGISSMPGSPDPRANHLLAALPATEWERWLPQPEPFEMPLGKVAQTAVCNQHHSLDQQPCRWLLLSLDRLEGDELQMTQELIANMLGTSVDIARLTHRNAGAAKSLPPWLCISIPRCVRRRTDLRSFGAHRAWNEPLAARFTALVAAVPGAVSQRIR